MTGENPDINAHYRSTPILTIDEVQFRAMTIKPSTKVKQQYRDTDVSDVKVRSHIDFNTRKLLLKESQ